MTEIQRDDAIRCTACGISKPRPDFHERYVNGRRAHAQPCRECNKARLRERRQRGDVARVATVYAPTDRCICGRLRSAHRRGGFGGSGTDCNAFHEADT